LTHSTLDGKLSSTAFDAADSRDTAVFVTTGTRNASISSNIGRDGSRKTLLTEITSNREGTGRTWVAINIQTTNDEWLVTVIATNAFACSDTERNRRTGTRDAAGAVGRKLSSLAFIASGVVNVWLKAALARNAFCGAVISRDAALGTGLAGLTVGGEGSSGTLSAV